jgi:hypothetical protein
MTGSILILVMLALASAFVLIPALVYVSVKLGTVAYLRGREYIEKERKRHGERTRRS